MATEDKTCPQLKLDQTGVSSKQNLEIKDSYDRLHLLSFGMNCLKLQFSDMLFLDPLLMSFHWDLSCFLALLFLILYFKIMTDLYLFVFSFVRFKICVGICLLTILLTWFLYGSCYTVQSSVKRDV